MSNEDEDTPIDPTELAIFVRWLQDMHKLPTDVALSVAYNVVSEDAVDNFRVFCLNPPGIGGMGEMENAANLYANRRRAGCCGFSDSLYYSEDTGTLWLVGFNYGH